MTPLPGRHHLSSGSSKQTLGLRTADLLARIELLESRLNLADGASHGSAS